MTTSETLEMPKGEGNQSTSAGESDKRPGGTMFDPETIRKFLEQIQKEDQ